MILVYALGGGLGHLTRVRAALATEGVLTTTGPITIVTSSPFAADARVTGGFDVVVVPEELARDRTGLGRFVASTLAAFASSGPAELLIDAFPAGILGELTASMIPGSMRTSYLARALRWSQYSPQMPPDPPTLDVAWILEPLEVNHQAYVAAHARAARPLTLAEQPGPARDRDLRPVTIAPDPRRPTWLIVHSGPDAEVTQLLAYAWDQAELEGADPRLLVISPDPVDQSDTADTSERIGDVRVPRIDAYPAGPLMAAADRVYTAGGFNALREAAAWPDKHRALPFDRTFDDQFARIRRARLASPALARPDSPKDSANL